MKAATLRRLDKLDLMANLNQRPRMQLVDLMKTPDALDAFLSGDTSVLPDVPEGVPAGVIHTLVISVHPTARDAWQETREMDEDALEELERRRDAEDARQASADREREYFDRVKAAADAARLAAVPEAPANAYSPDWD